MSDLEPGDDFAGHRIEAVAGRGGMGVVYRARQLDLGRTVALKVIAPALAQDQAFRERFVRESRAAASIDHPNVIPIYSAGEDRGTPYIAMRFVAGPDLRSLVRAHERLEPARAAALIAQVGSALDAAHAGGIVHRDVKPENVLIGDGDHAYLTDFGLTKRIDSLGGTTRTGGWVGTLGYVAPEQIRGERVDARADVYALGCLLVYALSGHAPFRRESDEAAMWAHLNAEPPRLQAELPDVPQALDAVIARAMAKQPGERFPSAGDLGRAARAACGADGSRPERSVATGAAAWESAAASAEVAATAAGATVATRDPDADRTPVQPTPPTSAHATPARRRLAARLGVLAGLLVAAGVVAAIVTSSGGDRTTTRPTTAKRPATPRAIAIDVGGRPNGVALAGGLAWVLRNPRSTLATIDLRSGKRTSFSPQVGAGPSAIAAANGLVWVASPSLGRVIPFDAARRRQVGRAVVLPGGRPVSLALDSRTLWVGMRSFGGASLVKVDLRTRSQRVLPLPHGLQAIAAGDGAIWVLERQKRRVARIDVADGQVQEVTVGQGQSAIAFGAGAAWVTSRDDDTVTRIDAGSLGPRRISVGDGPDGIAVDASGVWVANGGAGTLTRIDPRTSRADTAAVALASRSGNPYAVAAGGGQVWVTNPPDGAVTRVTARAG